MKRELRLGGAPQLRAFPPSVVTLPLVSADAALLHACTGSDVKVLPRLQMPLGAVSPGSVTSAPCPPDRDIRFVGHEPQMGRIAASAMRAIVPSDARLGIVADVVQNHARCTRRQFIPGPLECLAMGAEYDAIASADPVAVLVDLPEPRPAMTRTSRTVDSLVEGHANEASDLEWRFGIAVSNPSRVVRTAPTAAMNRRIAVNDQTCGGVGHVHNFIAKSAA